MCGIVGQVGDLHLKKFLIKLQNKECRMPKNTGTKERTVCWATRVCPTLAQISMLANRWQIQEHLIYTPNPLALPHKPPLLSLLLKIETPYFPMPRHQQNEEKWINSNRCPCLLPSREQTLNMTGMKESQKLGRP